MAPVGGYEDSRLGRKNAIESIRKCFQMTSVWGDSGAVTANPFVIRGPSAT